MRSDVHVDSTTAPLSVKGQLVAAAVVAFLQSRPAELLSLDAVFVGVTDKLAFRPTRSRVHTAVTALVRDDDNHVRKAWRGFYIWSPDGVIPALPTPPHVPRMIELRLTGMSLDDIGKEFDLTRERIRQLLKAHGGPTAAVVRAIRVAKAEEAEQARAEVVAAALRAALREAGPMSVDHAAERAGLDSDEASRFWPEDLAHLRLWGGGHGENRWSNEEILHAIREAALYEYPLTTSAYSELLSVGQFQGPSLPSIGHRFGSWTAACDAAGVVPGPTRRDNYESKWSDDDLLKIVRRYLLDPNVPNSSHRFDEWKRAHAPDGPSAPTLRIRFGSWTEVKRRALTTKDVSQ